jgi:hypothetical protein
MNTAVGLVLPEHVEKILSQVPAERLAQFRLEVGVHVTVGSGAGHSILINYATVPEEDELVIALKVLAFLTMELSMQLITKREADGQPRFKTPLPDTVLHEQGVRHDPMLCQHCSDATRLPVR